MASRIPFEHPLRHPHPPPLLLWPEQRKDTNSKPSTSLVFDPRIELKAAKKSALYYATWSVWKNATETNLQ